MLGDDGGDEQLLIAQRDRQISHEHASNAAYRDVLEEVCGEVYAAAFLERFQSTLAEQRRIIAGMRNAESTEP